MVFLGNKLVSWSSRKRKAIACSSTEVEYRAVAFATAELSWIMSLLSEINLVRIPQPIIWCDNIGTTYLIMNSVYHARTKQIKVDNHFVREKGSIQAATGEVCGHQRPAGRYIN